MLHEGKRSVELTQREIVRRWWPLLATWLMMASEGPMIAALVARLSEPKLNLAAYGVAFALALIVEAPIIMMMSAATTLARDQDSYLRLKRYAYVLNLAVTLGMLTLLVPPVFTGLMEGLVGLPPEVAGRTHTAVAWLLPWPAAIGFRRFFQGVVIADGRTRQIALATVVRLSTMVSTGALFALFSQLEGSAIGAAALSAGVVVEAFVVRWLASPSVKRVLARAPLPDEPTLTLRRFAIFYWPLALTALLSLAVQPVITFFVGRARLPVESLAVLPVVNAFSFLFRSVSLSLQELLLTLFGASGEGRPALRIFVGRLAFVMAVVYAGVAFTPLSSVWLEGVSGLTPELAAVAALPLAILFLQPLASVLLTYHSSTAIHAHRTGSISRGTVVEVVAIAATLALGVFVMDWVGAVAATAALALGRVVGATYMVASNARARGRVRRTEIGTETT